MRTHHVSITLILDWSIIILDHNSACWVHSVSSSSLLEIAMSRSWCSPSTLRSFEVSDIYFVSIIVELRWLRNRCLSITLPVPHMLGCFVAFANNESPFSSMILPFPFWSRHASSYYFCPSHICENIVYC